MVAVRGAVVALICFCAAGPAQAERSSAIWSLSAGASWSSPTTYSGTPGSNSLVDYPAKAALTLGTGFEFALSQSLSLQLSLLGFERSFEINTLGAEGAATNWYHGWVIQVPLTLKLRMDTGVFISGGVYASQAIEEFTITQPDGVRRALSYTDFGLLKRE